MCLKVEWNQVVGVHKTCGERHGGLHSIMLIKSLLDAGVYGIFECISQELRFLRRLCAWTRVSPIGLSIVGLLLRCRSQTRRFHKIAMRSILRRKHATIRLSALSLVLVVSPCPCYSSLCAYTTQCKQDRTRRDKQKEEGKTKMWTKVKKRPLSQCKTRQSKTRRPKKSVLEDPYQ